VAKMSYRWQVVDGKMWAANVAKIWEDVWVGTSSLAIKFWELYVIVNEQMGTIEDLWNGHELKCTFKALSTVRL
jgi:hypothetical protein